MPELERKYGVATTLRFPMIIAGATTLAAGGDWAPQAADTKLSKDAAAQNNSTNLPTFVNGMWDLDLTQPEMEVAQLEIVIIDVAGAEVEDQVILIETYGDPSAQRQWEASDFAVDLDVHTAKIFPMVSAVDGENVWGVIFFKNGIQMDGATVLALSPLITVYDEDASVLISAQAMARVTGQDGFKFVTTVAEMTAGIAYYAQVSHDDMADGWTEPLSVWN